MDPALDGDATGPHRRLAESFHLAQEMEAGPVRDALLQSIRTAAYATVTAAIADAQQGLAAARELRFEQALRHFEAAGSEAREALRLPWVGDHPAVDQAGPAAQRRTLGSLKGYHRRRTLGEI